MKKSIYLIIISVLTIACICFGSFYHIGNFKSKVKEFISDNNFEFQWDNDDEDWEDEDDWEDGSVDEKSGSVTKSKTSGSKNDTFSSFKNIDLNTHVSDITVKTGSEYSLECHYNRSFLEPIYEINGDSLRIKQKGPKNLNHTGNSHCSIVITIPRFANLDEVEIVNNVGDISISDFDCNDFVVKNNVGDVIVEAVNTPSMKIENNVGDVEVSDITDLDSYNIDASTNVGNVEVGGRYCKRQYLSNTSSRTKIFVKTNVGDVELD